MSKKYTPDELIIIAQKLRAELLKAIAKTVPDDLSTRIEMRGNDRIEFRCNGRDSYYGYRCDYPPGHSGFCRDAENKVDFVPD